MNHADAPRKNVPDKERPRGVYVPRVSVAGAERRAEAALVSPAGLQPLHCGVWGPLEGLKRGWSDLTVYKALWLLS